MRKAVVVLLSVALSLLLTSPLSVSAQEDPAALLQQFADTYNAGDLDGVRAMFAEDAVITEPSMEDPMQTTTYTPDEWIAATQAMEGEGSGGMVTLGEITVDGDTASATFEFAEPSLEEVGLNPITGSLTLVSSGGKIAEFTTTFDEEWLARAAEVMAQMQAEGQGEGEGEMEGEGMGEGAGEGEMEGDREMAEAGPDELPATGDAGDPLPLALAVGSMLLLGGVAMRRLRLAA